MRRAIGLFACVVFAAGCGDSRDDEAGAAPKAATEKATGASQGGYPARQVLEAFGTACADIASFDAAVRSVGAAGWSRISEPEASPVGPVLAVSRSPEARRMMEQVGGREVGLAAFARDVAGEQLHLVVSAVEVQGRSVVGCRMYDVDERRQIGEQALHDWIGRPETRRVTEQQALVLTWEPGLSPRQDSVEYYFVPAGSPVTRLLGLGGVMLKADIITGTPGGR